MLKSTDKFPKAARYVEMGHVEVFGNLFGSHAEKIQQDREVKHSEEVNHVERITDLEEEILYKVDELEDDIFDKRGMRAGG